MVEKSDRCATELTHSFIKVTTLRHTEVLDHFSYSAEYIFTGFYIELTGWLKRFLAFNELKTLENSKIHSKF